MAAPTVRVERAGKISSMLEGVADMFRKANPGMDCRYVYNPTHKPEMSNVMSRLTQGYRVVTYADLGDTDLKLIAPGKTPDDQVQVADLVLMSMPAEERARMIAAQEETNREELLRVEREFYDNTRSVSAETKDGRTHGLNPHGKASIQVREAQHDVEQRTEEE
jgi:hypothetical protein